MTTAGDSRGPGKYGLKKDKAARITGQPFVMPLVYLRQLGSPN